MMLAHESTTHSSTLKTSHFTIHRSLKKLNPQRSFAERAEFLPDDFDIP